MDTHPLDLGHPIAHRPQRAHGHKPSVEHSDQEFAAAAEISAGDRVKVSVPGPIAGVGADLVQGAVVKLPDGVRVSLLEPPEL